jgi:hypothetical protein
MAVAPISLARRRCIDPSGTYDRGGGPGEDTTAPGILVNWIGPRIVVQTVHRCPAVKVERPTDERP